MFGIERRTDRDILVKFFEDMITGILTVPLNLKFTRFNRSLKASVKVKTIIMDLVKEKRAALEQDGTSPNQDHITCLLNICEEGNSAVMSGEEIVDNCIIIMIAGYDSSSILLTFLVRLLAKVLFIYGAILHEQKEIAESRAYGEPLTWEDLMKMKYTWRVATETLRMTPPVFCSFRKTLKDVKYGGYLIPEGWQQLRVLLTFFNTQIVWAASMTRMDEATFPEPAKFDPTRYEQQAVAPPYSFVAFGGGPLMCPGNEFAKIETLSMIHYLETEFTWKETRCLSSIRDYQFKSNQRNPVLKSSARDWS